MLLEPGDVVLTDHGFDIADDIALHGGCLVLLSFTRGKKQLGLKDVECSQRIAMVCIHVHLSGHSSPVRSLVQL